MADSFWGPYVLVYLVPDCATSGNILCTMESYPFVIQFMPVLDLLFFYHGGSNVLVTRLG